MDKHGREPWPMVVILVLAAILSFIDRQILSLLVEPIKADLDIDDFAFSLIAGPAFAIFYALAGLPLGYLTDRVNRGRLIAAGIAGWSLMTALSGFASNYWHLFVARIGVGVGEATLGPAAHSLIADRFSPASLPLAMSVYGTGVALGAGMAFAIGGQVIAYAEALAASPMGQWPIFSGLAPWQLTFIVVGLPGLLLALVVLFGVIDTRQQAVSERPGLFEGVGDFWTQRSRLIVLHLTGVSLLTANGFAALVWLPSVFIRRFGWEAADVGLVIGLMLMVLGVGGVLAAGMLATRMAKRGRIEGPVVVVAVGAAITGLLAFTTILPTSSLLLAFLVPQMLVSNAFVGLGPAIIQSVTPPPLRGRVAALALMITSLAGMIIGPVGVGALTSFIFEDPQAVGLSLTIMTAVLCLGGALCMAAAIPLYRTAATNAYLHSGA